MIDIHNYLINYQQDNILAGFIKLTAAYYLIWVIQVIYHDACERFLYKLQFCLDYGGVRMQNIYTVYYKEQELIILFLTLLNIPTFFNKQLQALTTRWLPYGANVRRQAT
jgi:hypothetical protein